MASLPSLLARGYLRSRRIPRILTPALRFQHAPSTFPHRTFEPVDGRVDLFPSTRVSPIAGPDVSPSASDERIGHGVQRPKVTSSMLEKDLKPLGIPYPIINALSQEFPHIRQATPAQAALLKSVLKDGNDVFLKEKTGRGKTFAMTLIALSRALKLRSKRLKNAKSRPAYPTRNQSPSILVLLPHAALVGQVGEWISRIEGAMGDRTGDGPLAQVIMPGDKPTNVQLESEILVSTPDALLAYLQPSSSDNQDDRNPASSLSRSLHLLMVDEIDAMLRPLPGRFKTFTSERERNRHPFYRHPPSIVKLLDNFLRLGESNGKVQTVWSSATLNSVVRGFVQRSGWIRRAEQTMIDTAHEAEALEQSSTSTTSDTTHYCLTIDPLTGQMHNLGAATEPDVTDLITIDPSDPSTTEKIHPLLIENLALLHATRLQSPNPHHSLAIIPSGASIPSLQHALSSLGISSAILNGTPPPAPPTLLLIDRAHVRGLDLPSLGTVYLLNGLDVSSMSKSSRAAGGMEERKREYTHFAGRMDRLGGEGDAGYEMVNLVMRGSAEEKALQGLFADRADLNVGTLEGEGVEV